jgi:hypothetical protein
MSSIILSPSLPRHATPRSYGKNRDLAVPFWSTKDAGQQPFSFQIGLGSVIKAWDEGVAGMQLGEVARLTATPDYGCAPLSRMMACQRREMCACARACACVRSCIRA